MAHYVITGRQVLSTIILTALFAAVCVCLVVIFINYSELPEVWVSPDGKCVKVINYKNGDGYQCSDKDVTLRKYHVVHVAEEQPVSGITKELKK